jgi:alkylated DNA nucleotide flippase Atl1
MNTPTDRANIPRFGGLVLDVVDRIPPGRVMAYGDIAEMLGEGSARLVARMMSLYGSEVPWHRVLRADGRCAPEVVDRQLPLLSTEHTPFRTPDRVDMDRARWFGWGHPEPLASEPSAYSSPGTPAAALDHVRGGEEVVVTEAGIPLCRLVPVDPAAIRAQSLAARRATE